MAHEVLSGHIINGLLNRGLIGSESFDEETETVLPRIIVGVVNDVLSVEGLEDSLNRYINIDTQEWQIPKWSLKDIKQSSPDEIVLNYVNRYGGLQDLALFWPIVDQQLLNGHGRSHISTVWNDAKTLLRLANIEDLDLRRQLALGVAFHDSGVAFGGRQDHESRSLQVLESIIEGFDYTDEFCGNVSWLVACHTTTEATIDMVSENQMLAVLVLADEAHLEQRGTRGFDTDANYVKDAWIRIAEHVRVSDFCMEGSCLVWQIVTDGKETGKYASLLVEGDLLSDLTTAIFSKKADLYQTCVKSIFGPNNSFKVRFNGTDYTIDKLTDRLKMLDTEGDIYE